jgi:hypothetical protein
MVLREFIKHTFKFLVEAALHIVNFVPRWRMGIQNNSMKPATSLYYDILSLTNSILLTADMILLHMKKLYLIHGSHSPLHRKCVFFFWFGATASHLISWAPPKSNLYLDSYLDTVIREPALYILHTFQVPNLISILLHFVYIGKKLFASRKFNKY